MDGVIADRPFRVFISHSSPNSEARERLTELAKLIESEQPNVRVLFDLEQIKAGDSWRERISLMLHSCHAGVVLLDEAAVGSPWVLTETIVLAYHSWANPRFRFIPVAIGDQTRIREILGQGRSTRDPGSASWDTVGMEEFQFCSGTSAKDICDQVVRSLEVTGELPSDTLAERLADEIEPHLVRATGPKAVATIAMLLEDQARYYDGSDSYHAALGLVRLMLKSPRLAVVMAEIAKTRSRAVPGDDLFIADTLAPLLVPAVPAAVIARAAIEGSSLPHSSIAVTACPRHMIPLYLRRGHLPIQAPRYLFVANTHGSFAGLRTEMRKVARTLLHSTHIDDLPERLIDELIGGIPYLILPSAGRDLLREIAASFPDMVVIQYHRHSDRASIDVPEVPNVLTEDEELEVLLDYFSSTLNQSEDWG